MEVMSRFGRHTHRVATWALVVVLASVPSVVCLAGAWQTSQQDECSKAMGQGADSSAKHLDCCIADAPNFYVSIASVATVPPPVPTLIAVDLFGATPPRGYLSSSDGAFVDTALKPPGAPTYLLDSVFRI